MTQAKSLISVHVSAEAGRLVDGLWNRSCSRGTAKAERKRINISLKEGILPRINSSIQAEGIFGIAKQDMSSCEEA